MQMPGEALLLKMWETLIEKGIGGLITPFYIPWKEKRLAIGRVEVDKAFRIATAKAEQEIVEITDNKTKLIGYSVISSEENETEISVKNIVLNNDMKKLIREEINVAKAINYANERLIEDDSDVPKEDISQDWLNTWRDNASKVSDEEVQSLWGNVLAQEFLEPGRYSLRLLEFLRTMSKSDALLIEKISPFISRQRLIYGRTKQNGILKNDNDFMSNFNFLESEIDFLEEIGVISGISTLGKIATSNNAEEAQGRFLSFIEVDDNRVIGISSENPDRSLSYYFYDVTKMGSEIFSLIRSEISFDYIVWLGNQFVEDFDVSIYKAVGENYELEKTL